MTTQTQGQWDETQRSKITKTISVIANALVKNKVEMPIAASALMVVTAQVASESNNTDEYIIEQFRKCLFDARNQEKDMHHA